MTTEITASGPSNPAFPVRGASAETPRKTAPESPAPSMTNGSAAGPAQPESLFPEINDETLQLLQSNLEKISRLADQALERMK